MVDSYSRIMSGFLRVSLLFLGWEETYLIPLLGLGVRKKTTARLHKETSHCLPIQPLTIHLGRV